MEEKEGRKKEEICLKIKFGKADLTSNRRYSHKENLLVNFVHLEQVD